MNKEHVSGNVDEVKGKVKEKVGKATDHPATQAEGVKDQGKSKPPMAMLGTISKRSSIRVIIPEVVKWQLERDAVIGVPFGYSLVGVRDAERHVPLLKSEDAAMGQIGSLAQIQRSLNRGKSLKLLDRQSATQCRATAITSWIERASRTGRN